MLNSFFYFSLICLGVVLFIIWFMSGRKGGYGNPTPLDLKKGNNKKDVIVAADNSTHSPQFRDVTPQAEKLQPPQAPMGPPPKAIFVYNGHDWDAFEVLGVSPYSSFSEITKTYQALIRKADSGKHDFLQAAYTAILKKF